MCQAPPSHQLRRTVDFLLRARRDTLAAKCYCEQALAPNTMPRTAIIDNRGATLAALEAPNSQREPLIQIRRNKYANNIVEHDHRAIEQIVRPMVCFKDFRCARIILSGSRGHAHAP
ncbi:hypothetical protein C2L64_47940 [Paraburkholderia hospita]|uniref:DDE domain-containing protein n=1 Tax=Paraburkholderia hospita TaxID=169430 RepID=A0AAN1JKY1_9BURK|nr:hypothetical protein C2L64_47940 [Paraburkholderia hospita]